MSTTLVALPTTILVAYLRAALAHACTDETREHMHGVRVEIHGARVRFVATNGHVLFAADVDGEHATATASDVATFTIRAMRPKPSRFEPTILGATAKELIASLSRETSPTATIVVTEASVTISTATTVRDVATVKGVFPPYAQVLPAVAPRAVKRANVSIEATYLATAAEAFQVIVRAAKAHADGKGRKSAPSATTAITLDNGAGELDPVLVSCAEVPRAVVVVMPLRNSATSAAHMTTALDTLGGRKASGKAVAS